MTGIRENIKRLKDEVPGNISLVAVSKTKPVADILAAYNEGQRIFGENRVPELVSKRSQLPADIEWHMIGHLQTNKVKMLIPGVALIHSIDSLKLLETVNRESERAGVITGCLLQFHIAAEETKSGFLPDEADEIFQSQLFRSLSSVSIRGVMGMATFTDDMDRVRIEFRKLKETFIILKSKYFPENASFREISMGMSGDYKIAIEEGATMIRIGSLIFGSR